MPKQVMGFITVTVDGLFLFDEMRNHLGNDDGVDPSLRLIPTGAST